MNKFDCVSTEGSEGPGMGKVQGQGSLVQLNDQIEEKVSHLRGNTKKQAELPPTQELPEVGRT